MGGCLGSILTCNKVLLLSKMAAPDKKDQLKIKWPLNSLNGTLMNTPFSVQGWMGGCLGSNLTHNKVSLLSKMATPDKKDQLNIKWPPNSSLNGTLMNTPFKVQGWMGG